MRCTCGRAARTRLSVQGPLCGRCIERQFAKRISSSLKAGIPTRNQRIVLLDDSTAEAAAARWFLTVRLSGLALRIVTERIPCSWKARRLALRRNAVVPWRMEDELRLFLKEPKKLGRSGRALRLPRVLSDEESRALAATLKLKVKRRLAHPFGELLKRDPAACHGWLKSLEWLRCERRA